MSSFRDHCCGNIGCGSACGSDGGGFERSESGWWTGSQPEKIEPEKWREEQSRKRAAIGRGQAEQEDSAASRGGAPAEEVAAATFAEQNGEPVSEIEAAVAEENQDSSSDAGGRESMGKDVKAKSGKSNWHQIHTAPASAAATSDVGNGETGRTRGRGSSEGHGSGGSGRGCSVYVCTGRQHDCQHRGQRAGRSSPEDRGRNCEEAGGEVEQPRAINFEYRFGVRRAHFSKSARSGAPPFSSLPTLKN